MKTTFFNQKGKNHRYIYFIIAGLLLGSFFGALVHGTDTMYQYYAVASSDALSIGHTTSAVWRSQTFTTTTVHVITSVKLRMSRANSPGTLTVSIRATSGGLATGGDLCSGTLNANTFVTNESSGGSWYEITFGAGTTLLASTKYAICCRVSAGASGVYAGWSAKTPSGYATGTAGYSLDSGVTWNDGPSYDAMFYEFGTLVAKTSISISGILPVTDTPNMCPCDIVFRANISNTLGEPMTLTFKSNATGTFQTITGVANGSYSFFSTAFNRFGMSYDWNVTVTATTNTSTSVYYHFTTNSSIECIAVKGPKGDQGINGTDCNCTDCLRDVYSKTESDNTFLSALFNVESDLLFLAIVLSLWVYFVSKYFDKREVIFAEIQFGLSMPLTLSLAVFSFNYPLGVILVMLIPIFAIWILVSGFFYNKRQKNKR